MTLKEALNIIEELKSENEKLKMEVEELKSKKTAGRKKHDNVWTNSYNDFHASLLVRHTNDGKLYLYDIIDIKKEMGNPLG